MVSIRKAKQGFQLRKRGGVGGVGNNNNAEHVGMVLAGVGLGIFLIVWYNLTSTSTTGVGGLLGTDKVMGPAALLRQGPPHPHLKNHQNGAYLPDTYNAVAKDIIETLNCKDLLSPKDNTAQDEEQEQDEEEEERFRRRHRRLDEKQHGDDGGFDTNNNNNKGDSEGEGGNGGFGGDDKNPNAADDDDDAKPEEKWGREALPNGGNGNGMDDAMARDQAEQERFREEARRFMDDDRNMYNGGGPSSGLWNLNAKHLFCLAAMTEEDLDGDADRLDKFQSEFHCQASTSKRQSLLDLWSAARSQITSKDLLLQILELAQEHAYRELLGKSYHLWAPANDDGLQYLLNSRNSDDVTENGGIRNLQENLGPGKVFVDIGSCLGITVLAIHDHYPGTRIISVEPASPNWLLQELNLRCNIEEPFSKSNIKLILAGVGPNTEEEEDMMAKLLWRPTATTSTRAWTPGTERKDQDVELVVRLRKLKSILAEADIYNTMQQTSKGKYTSLHPLDVLNVDCEGCEYNLIPALSEEEFDAIPTVMGRVHWGYIPVSKLPSSERGRKTHSRLCQHETIAQSTKECCAFLDLPVKSSKPGEILIRDTQNNNNRHKFPPPVSTVQDVISDGFCTDFDTWAKEHYLNDVKDDWGWFELSSQAKV